MFIDEVVATKGRCAEDERVGLLRHALVYGQHLDARETVSDLRRNIDDGLAALFGEPQEGRIRLDTAGRAQFEFELPDMGGKTLVVAIQLRSADNGFTVSSRFGDLHTDMPNGSLRALLEMNVHIYSAGGAVFGIDEATAGLALIYHWPLANISAGQFQEMIETFMMRAMLLKQKFLQGDHDDPRLNDVVVRSDKGQPPFWPT